MVNALFVFGLGVIIDILYCTWSIAANRGNKLIASFSASGIAAATIFGLDRILNEMWLTAPYLCGIFLGTWIGVIIGERIGK